MVNQIDFVPILLILLISLFTRKEAGRPDNCFSFGNCQMIKGLMSVFVVLCHLSLIYSGGVILPVFEYLGDIAVGIFFFLSGYGLMKQYLAKEDYHILFLQKRFSKVFIPYLIINALYWFYYLAIGEPYGMSDFINTIKTGDLLVSYSWYVVEILILYLFFYLFMLIDRKKKQYMIILNIILYLALIIVFRSIHYAPHWYVSTYMYIFGLLYVVFERQFSDLLDKYKFLLLCLTIAFIVALLFRKKAFYYFDTFLLLLIILFLRDVTVKNLLLTFLGKISLEIYLLHGLVIKFFRRFISSEETFIALIILIILIIISSYVFNFIYSTLFRRKRKVLHC